MLMATLSLAMASVMVSPELDTAPFDRVVVAPGDCDTCGTASTAISALVVKLQRSDNPLARERAARELRSVDWRRHPDVPGALAYSLLRDPSRLVRLEAAQSLTRMGACSPVVHQAMLTAATRDPSLLTRLQARKGLKQIRNRCEGSCRVCEDGVPGVIMGPGAPVKVEPGVDTEILEPLPPASDPTPFSPPAQRQAPLESVPLERPEPGLKGDAIESPPIAEPGDAADSSVKSRDSLKPVPPPAEELSPLPDPDVKVTPPRPKPEAKKTAAPRSRVASTRPWFIVPRVGDR